MLILKYFMTVGVVLTLGLMGLSAYMDQENAAKAPRVQTTATVAVPAPPKPKVAEMNLYEEQLAPQGKNANQSGGGHRRSQR
jgi:hypothetical protein